MIDSPNPDNLPAGQSPRVVTIADFAVSPTTPKEFFSLRGRFTLLFSVLIIAIFTLLIISSVQMTHETLVMLSDRIGIAIAKRAAAYVDGDKFEQLCRTLDANDPYYDEMRVKFLELKKETHCLYVYSMAPKSGDTHIFVIDGGEPGAEGFSPLGEEENISAYTPAYKRVFETGIPETGEMNLQGSWGWVITSYVPIINSAGKVVGIVGVDFEAESVYREIKRKIWRQGIIAGIFIFLATAIYLYLLTGVVQQNRLLKESSDRDRAASKAKSEFLARMSHEIRTPMNAIIGLSELALREPTSVQVPYYVKNIHDSGVNLLAIINDILDLSKIEAGRMQINNASYALASVLNDVLTLFRTQIDEHALEFKFEVDHSLPASLIGDDVRVKQVLLNLLSNAIKYTDKGFVKLTIGQRERSRDSLLLVLTVKDSGIGMSSRDQRELFNDFSRFSLRRNKQVQGTGLGLSIARKMCQAMGGDIKVKSELGKGSTFIATLRQSFTDSTQLGGDWLDKPVAANEVLAAKFTAPDFRVLIVDDVDINLTVCEGMLEPFKMQVELCDSGENAVKLANKHEYDLIFMDHMMPGMDGVEATQIIRKMPHQYVKELPIIALTANAVSGMREMFLANGFTNFISKPIEIEKLYRMLEHYVPAAKKKPINHVANQK